MTKESHPIEDLPGEPAKMKVPRSFVERLRKNSFLILTVLILIFIVFSLLRASIYKIRPYERGLHLRGGSFVGIDLPGWHFQIPFVDTVIGLNVSERPGTIDSLAAMTADDVTMDDVMHSRADFNQELMVALQQKEARYGVEFVLVQIQNASPPLEVVAAIKDKMVAKQLQEKAIAEAAQAKTLADSDYYTAQKQAEGEAYQITRLAEAEAQRIELSSAAKVAGLRAILAELEGKGTLAEQYIQVLIAQELKENSKWVITGGDAMPILDLAGNTTVSQTP